jgi:hypothetical protein
MLRRSLVEKEAIFQGGETHLREKALVQQVSSAEHEARHIQKWSQIGIDVGTIVD